MVMTYRIETTENGKYFYPLKTNCLCDKGKYYPLNTICSNCNGTKKEPKDRRKKCRTCSGTGKTRSPETCPSCNGNWQLSQDADLYNYIPDEVIANIPKKVVRKERGMSWAESYIGLGLSSCTDYGRHKVLSDEELISTAFDSLIGHQAIKVVRKEDNRLCDYIAIVTADQGYSLIPIWND